MSDLKLIVLVLCALAVGCDKPTPDCERVKLLDGTTMCAEYAFAELECHYHGEDRARWGSMFELDYTTVAVTGACNDHVTFDIEPWLRGRFDLAKLTRANPILAKLGFKRVTYCFGGEHCESSTHTRPYEVHPRTLMKLDELGVDVPQGLAGGGR